MKPLNEYTFADWRRLRPISHCMKTLRYRWVDNLYMRRSSRIGDPAVLREAIRGKRLLVTIAFGDPECIEWQARLLRLYVPQALSLIADNSPDELSAASIAAFAEREQILYLRLPENPWPAPSRSHGIALNWVWRNIIRPGEPEAFGFLDDDLFPTAPDDPFAPLSRQAFYGQVREAETRWFLWAGFCFFHFESVKNRALDFGQDWFNGLDSGGGNWKTLYRHVERAALQEAHTVFVPFKPGVEVADGPLQWCGSWLHEVGLMGRADLAGEKRQVVAEMLKEHLALADAIPQAVST